MNVLRANILRRAKQDGPSFALTAEVFGACVARTGSLEQVFENFLGTGNLPSQTGLGLMQNKVTDILSPVANCICAVKRVRSSRFFFIM